MVSAMIQSAIVDLHTTGTVKCVLILKTPKMTINLQKVFAKAQREPCRHSGLEYGHVVTVNQRLFLD